VSLHIVASSSLSCQQLQQPTGEMTLGTVSNSAAKLLLLSPHGMRKLVIYCFYFILLFSARFRFLTKTRYINPLFIIPPYGNMGILSLLFVCFLFVFCMFFVRLRISQRRKKIDAGNFAYVFDCYPYKSSPSVCLFGVTATALFPG